LENWKNLANAYYKPTSYLNLISSRFLPIFCGKIYPELVPAENHKSNRYNYCVHKYFNNNIIWFFFLNIFIGQPKTTSYAKVFTKENSSPEIIVNSQL